MAESVEEELQRATDLILRSTSRKKLIVAGPGAGKTTIFKKLLERAPGDRNERLVLTFIKTLTEDLTQSLGTLSAVQTLHGYSLKLLHNFSHLRQGLTSAFRCQPRLASLIEKDWEYLSDKPAPSFLKLMRELSETEQLAPYLRRGSYYDAVDFDDAVYRAFTGLANSTASLKYELILIDEYQDFNRLEASFIERLATTNPIVIAGDDDQALYSQLRGASWAYIRSLHAAGRYEVFALPFCMRCPEVIVGAVNDLLSKAKGINRLVGRIEKPYRYYEPRKGADSKKYPRINLVTASVQRQGNANYLGRYIEEAVRAIPAEEIVEATDSGDAPVLIIGPIQYRRQIAAHFEDLGYTVDTRRDKDEELAREDGLRILAEDNEANLGWRIILEHEPTPLASHCIRAAGVQPLVNFIPDTLKAAVRRDVDEWKTRPPEEPGADAPSGNGKPIIKLTSFESAKGLSGAHVFIVGLEDGSCPRDGTNVKDIEVCQFVVGLTRTKKCCTLMYTERFAGRPKRSPSPFLSWIKGARFQRVRVDAAYWRARKARQ